MSKKEQSFQDTPVKPLYEAHPLDKANLSPLLEKLTKKELVEVKVRSLKLDPPVLERWGVILHERLAIVAFNEWPRNTYGVVHLPTGYLLAEMDFVSESVSLQYVVWQLLQDSGRRFLDSADFSPRNKFRMDAAVCAWRKFVEIPLHQYLETHFPEYRGFSPSSNGEVQERLIELILSRFDSRHRLSQLDEFMIQTFQDLTAGEEDPLIKRAANPQPGDIYEYGLLRFQTACVSIMNDHSGCVVTLKDLNPNLQNNDPEFITIPMAEFNETSKLGERTWKLVQESNQS